MDSHGGALVLAGVLGSGVAIIHGLLVQRFLIRPVQEAPPPVFNAVSHRLLVALLQFSTFNWFVGGIALVLSAFNFARDARLATAALVASSYLFGAFGNLWSIRRPHLGWILYGVAICLIGYGVT